MKNYFLARVISIVETLNAEIKSVNILRGKQGYCANIYLTSNQEQIIAITEKVFPLTNKEHITVRYSGTGADICNSIEIYDNSLGEGDYLQCNESQGTHYIVSGLPAGINLWPQLTSKLRPEP